MTLEEEIAAILRTAPGRRNEDVWADLALAFARRLDRTARLVGIAVAVLVIVAAFAALVWAFS